MSAVLPRLIECPAAAEAKLPSGKTWKTRVTLTENGREMPGPEKPQDVSWEATAPFLNVTKHTEFMDMQQNQKLSQSLSFDIIYPCVSLRAARPPNTHTHTHTHMHTNTRCPFLTKKHTHSHTRAHTRTTTTKAGAAGGQVLQAHASEPTATH